MKLRVMGTKDECALARNYYRALEKDPNVKSVSVSGDYPNRGSSTLFRVYIEIEYYDLADVPAAPRDELDEIHAAIRAV